MPIKGLLITLDEDPEKAASALTLLEQHAEIELGERKEKYVPIVMDTGNEYQSRQLHGWIEKLDGVYFVDTVFSSVDGPA